MGLGLLTMENPVDHKPAKPASRAGFGLSLKGRALRYLAAREHSRAELERKLAPHEETPGQLAQVLDDLEAKDFISEARMVDSVINRRAAKLGASRIQYELQNLGIQDDMVREAVARLQVSELERAREVWRKKFGEAPATATERVRHIRFLASRGFSSATVSRILKNPEDDAV